MISGPKLIGWGEGEGLVGQNSIEFIIKSIYGDKSTEPHVNAGWAIPNEPHIYMYRIGPNYQGEGDNWYAYEGYISTCDTYFTNENGITGPTITFTDGYDNAEYDIDYSVETNHDNAYISVTLTKLEPFEQDTEFAVELWRIV